MNFIDVIGNYLQSGRAWYNRNENTIKVITVHHDAIPHDNRSAEQIMSAIMKIHSDNGWPGMSYHIYIHRDGKVYLVNKFGWVTWHDGHNYDSLGVIVTGYFHPPHNNKPTEAQLKSLKEVLDWLCTQNPQFPASQKDVYGHRERMSTACPGDTLTPYVIEYREKLGKVTWGSDTPPADEYGNMVKKSNQWDETCKYYDLGDPNHTMFERLKNYISGIKSSETTCNNNLNDTKLELAKEKSERENREEQVGRLKDEVIEKDKVINSLTDQLKSREGSESETIKVLRGQLEAMTNKYKDEAKAKGEVLNQVAEWKTKYESCKNGVSEKTLIDIIIDFLRGYKK